MDDWNREMRRRQGIAIKQAAATGVMWVCIALLMAWAIKLLDS